MENKFWKLVDKVYVFIISMKKEDENRQFPINNIL
jgi:hypothetical protein